MEWNLKDRKELTKINIRQTDRQNRRNMMHVCTLSYWLDEPRLHDSSLYVPALPAEYQAQLLVTVFQSQTVSITIQSLVIAPCRLWVRR